uniref:Uncharacterized protein n=1 Tax=Magallana gigas TaxID=29159 RepID=A0A8W8IRC2_MAGGI
MSERKQQQQSKKKPPQPIDEGWSWLILAAAVLVTFLWGGVVRAFGVLFVELRTEFGLSTSLLSLVVALHTALFTIGGLFALTYGVRYLTGRQCVFIGAILAVLSFVFSSLAKNGLILFVSYGFLLGLSFSFAIGPSTLLVSLYFKEKRNLTTWCLQMSPSIGAMLSAPLLRGLIDRYLLKGCLLIMAAILSHFLLASVLMRPPELYKKWQRLKKKIEKNRMKTTLLGKDGFPVEPFRARSPTSDSTFSPLARQAMLQRMKSRNDDEEDNPTSVQSDKSKKKLIEPEQKKTENIEERGHDTNPTKRHTENWRQRAMYASYDFGISASFLEQRCRDRQSFGQHTISKSIIGICSGTFQSLHANIIRRCVRPEEVSSGMCLLHFAQGLSWTVVIAITGFLRDLTGSYNMSFTILGSLGVASSIFIAASRLCLRKHREVYHPETGELENQEIIIK